jgi:ActR/RegA family two-component response regulator
MRDRERLAATFPARWQVIQCNDVETAKRFLEIRRPSLVIVELQLGGGMGFDVAQVVSPGTICRLALVSGQLSVAASVRAYSLGFALVAQKPILAADLLTQLELGADYHEPASRMTLERAAWEYTWRRVLTSETKKEAALKLGLHARSVRRMLARLAPIR